MAKEAAVPSTGQSSSQNQAKADLAHIGNLAVKCPKCREMLLGRDWEKNLKVCPRCSYHFKLDAFERIELITDPDSFTEIDKGIISVDPLNFSSRSQVYATKLEEERKSVNLNEAVGH